MLRCAKLPSAARFAKIPKHFLQSGLAPWLQDPKPGGLEAPGLGQNRRAKARLKYDDHPIYQRHRPICRDAEEKAIRDLGMTDPAAMLDMWNSKYKFFSNNDTKRVHSHRLKAEAERCEIAGESGWQPSQPGPAYMHRHKAMPNAMQPMPTPPRTAPSRLLTEEPQKHAFFNGGGNMSSRFKLQGVEDPWVWATDRTSATANIPWEHHDLPKEVLEKPGVGTTASFSVTNPPIDRFRGQSTGRRVPFRGIHANPCSL